MKLSNLQARPDKYLDTLALIEKSFGYDEGNSFAVDFYPLMKEGNRKNCWILLDDETEEETVVAHCGALSKEFYIDGKSFSSIFIGGVAVDEAHRGQGHSSKLLKHIFATYPHAALYVLWSDKVEMYKKAGFQPCIELFQNPQRPSPSLFEETELSKLSKQELSDIISLYQNPREIRVHRSERDWKDLEKITSARLFIKRDQSKISNYFFLDKGQDLNGVIHEYGHLKDRNEMSAHGLLWSSQSSKDAQALFGSLVRPGEFDNFKRFIQALSGKKITVESLGDEIKFRFDQKDFSMEVQEFLQGVMGPGRFQELNALPKLFISGMDSV